MTRPPPRQAILALTVVAALLAVSACRSRSHGHGQYGHGKLTATDEEPLLPPPPPQAPPVDPPPPPPPPPPPDPRPEPRQAEPTICGAPVKGAQTASVQGVDPTDVLNIREKPEFHSAILGSLPPDATGVSVVGPPRGTKTSTWRQVVCGKTRGWVRDKFLAIDER